MLGHAPAGGGQRPHEGRGGWAAGISPRILLGVHGEGGGEKDINPIFLLAKALFQKRWKTQKSKMLMIPYTRESKVLAAHILLI